MDSAKPIYKYLLKQNTRVVELITHGETLFKLSELIKPFINQHIGDHWCLGNVSIDKITLLVSSPQYANRLRFHSVKLLSEIRSLEFFKLLKEINIKVHPDGLHRDQEKKPVKKHALQPSKSGQQQLQSLAGTVNDPALKASLKRLAEHLRP